MNTTLPSTEPPFYFRKRYDKLNWKSICNIDLEHTISTCNIQALQSIIENITYSDVTITDISTQPDINIVQLIRCTQLICEYLLNIQNYLLNTNNTYTTQNHELLQQLDACKQIFIEKDLYITTLKTEIKQLKKLNLKYEKLTGKTIAAVTKHSTAQHNNTTQYTGPIYQCKHCSAGFMSEHYLQSHINRRHNIHTEVHNTTVNNTLDTTVLAELEHNITNKLAAHIDKNKPDVDTKLALLQQQIQQQYDATQAYLEQHNLREQQRLQLLAQQNTGVGNMYDTETEAQKLAAMQAEMNAREQALKDEFERNKREALEQQRIQSELTLLQQQKLAAEQAKRDAELAAERAAALLREQTSPVKQPSSPINNTDTAARQRLYDVLEAHKEKQYVMFADMPYLKARYNHNTTEINQYIQSFHSAVNSMMNEGVDSNGQSIALKELYSEIDVNQYNQQLSHVTVATTDMLAQHYVQSDELVEQQQNYKLWNDMHIQHKQNLLKQAESIQQQQIEQQKLIEQQKQQEQQHYAVQQQKLLHELQVKQYNAVYSTPSTLYTQQANMPDNTAVTQQNTLPTYSNVNDRLLSTDSTYQQTPTNNTVPSTTTQPQSVLHTRTSSAVSIPTRPSKPHSLSSTIELPVLNESRIQAMYDDDVTNKHGHSPARVMSHSYDSNDVSTDNIDQELEPGQLHTRDKAQPRRNSRLDDTLILNNTVIA